MIAASAGIYLHVPFCRNKCSYCNFFSISSNRESIQRYYQCVIEQIEQLGNHSPWNELNYNTIFMGGGTPSILPAEMLVDLLEKITETFHLSLNEMEISIEVNPATVEKKELLQLIKSGFNRLSIGTQSFNDRELNQIGRVHTALDTIQTIEDAQEVGFTNISIDLMYGLPDQDIDSWNTNLEKAVALNPQHLSIYELTLEPDTPMHRWVKDNKITLPEEETILEMMAAIAIILGPANFSRYEISNYSLPGFQCKHNLNYWHNGSYLGLGPAAVSSHHGSRWAAPDNIDHFCRQVAQHNIANPSESLDKESYFRETVIMGLRLTEGVNVDSINDRFKIDLFAYYNTILEPLIKEGFLEYDNGFLYLSDKGLAVANRVMVQLV